MCVAAVGAANAPRAKKKRSARPPPLSLSSLTKVRFPADATYVLLSLRSTGGKAARLVSLAARVLGGGEPFYKWVLTARTASKEVATRTIDGLSLSTVQERATDKFAAIGAQWLQWLEAHSAGSSTIMLITWDDDQMRPLELLCTELRRSELQLPSHAQLLTLDLGTALTADQPSTLT